MKRSLLRCLAILLIAIISLSVPSVIVNAEGDPSFELTKAYGNAGDTVQVELKINNNPGITAFSVSIGYSTDDLELIGIDDEGLFEFAISYGKLDANPVTISWYAADSGNKTDNGTVAVLKFRILDEAENSQVMITYDPENVFDSNLQNKRFVTVDGLVGIGEEPTEPPTAPAKVYLLGDVDGDDMVTIIDATYIQRKLASLPNQNGFIDEASDTDGDGSLSILDATFIQRWLAGLSSNDKIGQPIG